MLADRGVIRTGNEIISAGKNFKCHLILRQILKYKDIIKMNLILMVLIKGIIYLRWRMGLL